MTLSRPQQLLVRGLAVAIFSAAAIYVFAVPWIQDLLTVPPGEGQIAVERMSLPNAILIRVMEVFMAGWFFVLGSAIGSFLNVVIYRIPLGISLIRERSRCPVCLTAIAGKDNIPIFGWLRLNGRCRNCGCEISARYPKIEFLCGLFFLLFFYVELISGGANIPLRPVNTYTGIVWIIFYTKLDLVIYYLFHMSILSTLLAWGMMQFDGNSVPRRSMLSCTGLVVACSLLCSWLQPVPLIFPVDIPNPFPTSFSGMYISMFGLLAGSLIGILVSRMNTYLDRPSIAETRVPALEMTPRTSAMVPAELACLAICGATFGWQMVVLCGISTVAISLVLRTISGVPESLRLRSTGLLVFGFAGLHLVFWRALARVFVS